MPWMANDPHQVTNRGDAPLTIIQGMIPEFPPLYNADDCAEVLHVGGRL